MATPATGPSVVTRRGVLAAAAGTLLLGACGRDGGRENAVTRPTPGHELVVGATLELSGPGAALGVLQQRALAISAAALNEKGVAVGNLRRTVRVEVLDNRSNPRLAAQQATELVAGTTCTPCSEPPWRKPRCRSSGWRRSSGCRSCRWRSVTPSRCRWPSGPTSTRSPRTPETWHGGSPSWSAPKGYARWCCWPRTGCTATRVSGPCGARCGPRRWVWPAPYGCRPARLAWPAPQNRPSRPAPTAWWCGPPRPRPVPPRGATRRRTRR